MPPKSFGRDELRKLLSRLHERKDCYLLFMRNYAVPSTNNLAERDLRHCKLRQKISGCFRTWEGLVRYAKIRSIVGTARKRGESVVVALSTEVGEL